MTNYSLPSVIFIVFNFISITSIIILILILLKSPSSSTKWTLFQICLAILGYNICSVLTILEYGDNISHEAFGKPICIIQPKLLSFFFYPLFLLPCVLAFHLWFGTINSNLNVENNHFWIFTLLIWGFALIYGSTILIVSGFERNWGVMATNLLCEEAYNIRSMRYLGWLFQGIMIMVASISLFFTIRSTMITWQRWKVHKKNPNRATANELDNAVRMIVYIYLYCMTLCFYLILEITQQIKSGIDYYYYIGEFINSLFGLFLLLIFGTKKSIALSLPCCCCYRDPDDGTSPDHLGTATDTKIERTLRDTINSEAITIEILTEDNDRFSATFSENQKRTRHHSLQNSTNGKRTSKSSKSSRRHSDTTYERERRERRHNSNRRHNDRRRSDKSHSNRRHSDIPHRRVVSNPAENSRRFYVNDFDEQLENRNTDNNKINGNSNSNNNDVVNNGSGGSSNEQDLQRIWRQF